MSNKLVVLKFLVSQPYKTLFEEADVVRFAPVRCGIGRSEKIILSALRRLENQGLAGRMVYRSSKNREWLWFATMRGRSEVDSGDAAPNTQRQEPDRG